MGGASLMTSYWPEEAGHMVPYIIEIKILKDKTLPVSLC